MAQWPTTRGRLEGWLGHGKLARSSHGGGPRAARLRARLACWRRGHRSQPAHSGVLTVGPVVASRWQGVVGKLIGTTGRASGKEGLAGLTEVVA
jgi:hypothetical protein